MSSNGRLASLATACAGAIALGAVLTGNQAAAVGPTVIDLTQVACQFIESENGVDHGFATARKGNCEAINAQSEDRRLDQAKVLELAPGSYVFRVTNRNVPYELGFWLRRRRPRPHHPAQRFGRRPDGRGDQGLRDRARAGRVLLLVPAQPNARLPHRREGLTAAPAAEPGRLSAGPLHPMPRVRRIRT